MKRVSLKLPALLAFFLFFSTTVNGAEQKLPLVKGKEIVAIANGDMITLEEFQQELAGLNQGKAKEEKPDKKEEAELLKRLINTRLILQEARKIGLDELPEIRKMVDVFSRVTLREELMKWRLKDIKVDDEEVDKIYQQLVKEWKIKSVMIEKEDEAKKMEEELKAGGDFDEVAKKLVTEGIAKGGGESGYLNGKDLSPEIARVLSTMEVGSISPIIPIKSGFIILKLEDIRQSDELEAKKRAKWEALVQKGQKAFEEYNGALIKKYVKLNHKVLDSLDFESKEPGFEKLLKDQRVVATISGEKPVTVAELSDNIRQQFYHGIGRAIEEKKVNEKKLPILDEMLFKRVFRKEALRLGIDKTPRYKERVKEYENSVVFGAFVQKAVAPDVKIEEEELNAYYRGHIGEYTYPEMIKMISLAFVKRGDAEDCIEKVRKGTDLQWLMTNAEGQVNKNAKNLLSFEGSLLTVRSLPEGVQKVVSGARPGEVRLYESPEGYFYVLAVQNVIPAKPQPFEEVKKKITKIVFDDKLKKAVEEWAEKLRAVSDVKIYLKN